MYSYKPKESLENLIQVFQESYEFSRGKFDENLHNLAKQIVDRLTPEILASNDNEFHTFGYRLTKVFRDVPDKIALLKIAKTYEVLGDYYLAKVNYLYSRDRGSIIRFISRSIRDPRMIDEGISALRKIEKPLFGLVESAFYNAFRLGRYDLAMDIAYLTGDKWKEKEVLDALGLTQNSTVL